MPAFCANRLSFSLTLATSDFPAGEMRALPAHDVDVAIRSQVHALLRRHPDPRRAREQHHRFRERIRAARPATSGPAARRRPRHAVLCRIDELLQRIVTGPEGFSLMHLADLRHRLDQPFRIGKLLLRFAHIERLAVRLLRMRRHIQPLPGAHRTIRIRTQIKTRAKIRAARVAVLFDQVT